MDENKRYRRWDEKMKWIKNGNQLINMAHVEVIKIMEETLGHELVFYGEGCDRVFVLNLETLEAAEKELEHVAAFLEHQHTTIMAMAPTNEEEL